MKFIAVTRLWRGNTVWIDRSLILLVEESPYGKCTRVYLRTPPQEEYIGCRESVATIMQRITA